MKAGRKSLADHVGGNRNRAQRGVHQSLLDPCAGRNLDQQFGGAKPEIVCDPTCDAESEDNG
jgi:hypothetical protein